MQARRCIPHTRTTAGVVLFDRLRASSARSASSFERGHVEHRPWHRLLQQAAAHFFGLLLLALQLKPMGLVAPLLGRARFLDILDARECLVARAVRAAGASVWAR